MLILPYTFYLLIYLLFHETKNFTTKLLKSYARCDFTLIANLSNWADCQMANTNPLTLKTKQEIIST